MPTGTFFRLPEEKKHRLVEAAWAEFTTTRFSEASVNRIVRAANIPRGSFYQYFENKEDLFLYLCAELCSSISSLSLRFLQEANGDLFAVPLLAFDCFLAQRETPDAALLRGEKLLCLNHGMDAPLLLQDKLNALPQELMTQINLSRFISVEPPFIQSVFFLLIASLADAMVESLRCTDSAAAQREALQNRIDIIRCGSLVPRAANAGGTL